MVVVVVLVVAQSTEHQGQAGLYWGEGGGREFRGDKVGLRGREGERTKTFVFEKLT